MGHFLFFFGSPKKHNIIMSTSTSKDALLKSMRTGDTATLYNALQNPFYSVFVDVRKHCKYQKCRIKNTLNIPLQNIESNIDTKDDGDEHDEDHITKNEIERILKE